MHENSVHLDHVLMQPLRNRTNSFSLTNGSTTKIHRRSTRPYNYGLAAFAMVPYHLKHRFNRITDFRIASCGHSSIEVKQNNIAQVPPSKADEPLPPPAPFIQQSECAKDIAELQPISSAKVYGLELATMSKLLSDLTLQISDPNQWQNAQTEQSIKPAQFDENGKINYVRAELKMEKPDQEESEAAKKKQQRKSPEISKMLKPLKGYTLLSLKCNNLPTGAALRTRQLPVLVDLFGLIHHPVGVVASTELGNHIIYEIDYCSLTAEDIADGLTIAEDGSVAKPFPDTVWITEKVRNISEFYVLYLVKSDSKAIITSVQPTGSQTPAQFKEYQGFLVR